MSQPIVALSLSNDIAAYQQYFLSISNTNASVYQIDLQVKYKY